MDRDVPTPGLLVRTLGTVLPGVRRTGEQILAYSRAWSEVAEAALASPQPLWVVLGDSLSQGIGASAFDLGFVGRLSAALASEGRPHGVVNLARSGARIGDVLTQQLPALDSLGRAPALLTCTVGSNDLLRNPWPWATYRALEDLVAALPSGTVMATVPDGASGTARAFNRRLRRCAAEHGIDVADVAPRLRSWRGKVAADGFHPNDAGYTVWVEAFAAVLPRN
jgi:lysophospholipase L1-like esterase